MQIRAIWILMFLLSSAASALAQDGGKLTWRGKNESPKDALAEAMNQGRPSLLFFTSPGCKYCHLISEGAFSDSEVVSVSSGLVCIFVDCDWGKKNAELATRFQVGGYPTIAFVDPSGKDAGRLQGREVPEVLRELKAVVQKYPSSAAPAGPPAKPTYPEYSATALSAAKSASKPILIFFYDQSPATDSVTRALSDPLLRDFRDRLILTQTEYRNGSPLCTRCEILRAPTLLLLDPAKDNPEEQSRGRISGSRGPRELVRDLEELLGGSPTAAPKLGTTPPPPAGGAHDQDLSDDEIDRKFIQARITVAIDANKRGRKAKAIDILEDVIQSYPKHVLTKNARDLMEELRKQP